MFGRINGADDYTLSYQSKNRFHWHDFFSFKISSVLNQYKPSSCVCMLEVIGTFFYLKWKIAWYTRYVWNDKPCS